MCVAVRGSQSQTRRSDGTAAELRPRLKPAAGHTEARVHGDFSLPVTLLLNAFLAPFDGGGYGHKSLVLGQYICQHFPQWFVLPRVKIQISLEN